MLILSLTLQHSFSATIGLFYKLIFDGAMSNIVQKVSRRVFIRCLLWFYLYYLISVDMEYPQYAHCLSIFASLGYCWAFLHHILNVIYVHIDSILFYSIPYKKIL